VYERGNWSLGGKAERGHPGPPRKAVTRRKAFPKGGAGKVKSGEGGKISEGEGA